MYHCPFGKGYVELFPYLEESLCNIGLFCEAECPYSYDHEKEEEFYTWLWDGVIEGDFG